MAKNEVRVRQEEKSQERWLRPQAFVYEESDGRIVVEVEMPGVDKSALDIQVENNEMHITGRQNQTKPQGKYLIRERLEGSYQRSFTIDDTIDPEKIDASMNSGVLTVILNRKESAKPRKLTIKAG